MQTLHDPPSSLKSSVIAAVLLVAVDLLRQLATTFPPTVRDVLAATGSSRSQAYEMKRRLLDACGTLHEPAGRPVATAPPPSATQTVLRAVRDWLFDHPGAVVIHEQRREYGADFRTFVVELAAPDGPGAELTVAQLADLAGVPLGTVKGWLAHRLDAQPTVEPAAQDPAQSAQDNLDELAVHPDIATILLTYRRWSGRFGAFCDHLREQHGLRCGRTFVASVLQAAGLRATKRRGGPKSAPWSPDTFRRFFPGAQWLGDGTELTIEVDGQPFVFNLEAIMDVHTNAVVGIDVTDSENEDTLLTSFHNGLTTTGEHPLSLSVDNKPCNHTDLVQDCVAPTDVLRSTPGRGEAKAPLEGAFGLLQQAAPPLIVGGGSSRELARSVLALSVTLWMWGRNGRPRRRLGGRSPALAYQQDRPRPEQIEEARRWIAQLQRRADKARRTAQARADPVRRTLLREGLARLAIDDPQQRLEVALARYAREAIVRGLATFEAKTRLNTVGEHAEPGRYLGGVIRNINDQLELEATAERLLDLRIRQRHLSLRPIQRDIDDLRRTTVPAELPDVLAQRALDATTVPAVRLYTRHTIAAVTALPPLLRNLVVAKLIRKAARRFNVDKARRADLIATLTAAVH